MVSLARVLTPAALTAALLLSSCAGGDDAASPEGTEPAPEGAELSEEEIAAQEQQEDQARFEEAVDAQEAALAGPGEQHRSEAADLVAEMTPAQRAGQVIIGEYTGTDVDSAAELLEQHHLAGVILMGHNIPTSSGVVDIEALEAQIDALASSDRGTEEGSGDAVPPIISVDQEGGLVTRVGAPLLEWPTPMASGAVHQASGELWSVGQLHRYMAQDLADLGFTVTFAPNADVTMGQADPTMGSRTFGADPDSVGPLALQGLRGLADAGLAGSIKHFPGHGSVTEDSHATLPVQQRGLSELRQSDWKPFAEVIEAGAPMVMMGHIEVPEWGQGAPSSLSAAAYAEIRDMGHEGVIVTDAMNMAAIADRFGGDQAVVEALAAGADLILMPHSSPGAHGAIIEAVESGELEADRLSEAAERVVALALWQQELMTGELEAGPGVSAAEQLRGRTVYGPLGSGGETEEPGGQTGGEDREDADDDDPAVAGDAAAVAEHVAVRAITLVEGECEAELVTEALQIHGGTEQDRQRLAAAAQEAGLEVGYGPVVTLLGGSTPGSGEVVVALDRPEPLADSAGGTKLALYGRTAETFDALVAVLTGAEAPGALPVEVGEYPVGHAQC
ncbi:glycoside hydrolase family 3 N-terminal domain-containing protein [Nesterenkonia sphaerica]|uniref:beta-N-acetylhexosaminidase n=1 Tax=Nesterenkonia sphaerica TaxID=1804988 RepID=A0A5R9AH65_9MICC|nr:glycoside hydrolase family 3 N-terminal domain-containing protein [Nesterenkonia sphaerica]TLP77176.1 beta-N-acetylhexosaminidase [Nesterenkonia sphaerica]